MNRLCVIIILCYIILLNKQIEASNKLVKCPEECECYIETGMFHTDCANKKLKELPVQLDMNVNIFHSYFQVIV